MAYHIFDHSTLYGLTSPARSDLRTEPGVSPEHQQVWTKNERREWRKEERKGEKKEEKTKGMREGGKEKLIHLLYINMRDYSVIDINENKEALLLSY